MKFSGGVFAGFLDELVQGEHHPLVLVINFHGFYARGKKTKMIFKSAGIFLLGQNSRVRFLPA
jgi:hypothetical protein